MTRARPVTFSNRHGLNVGDILRLPLGGQTADLEIVGVYYDAAPDKAAAVREILAVTDYEVFLERSGYAERFSSE